MPSPCGGHLLCRISVASTNNNAQKVGPLQGAFQKSHLQAEKRKDDNLEAYSSVKVLKSLGACGAIPYCISYANMHKICSLELICAGEAVKKYAISG
jgi:hypothetical protein